MKILLFTITVLFFAKFSASQEYSFPLYFEDNAGNKDTLFFGFDPSASFGIDENLGETNIIDQTIDTTFFLFFTDVITKQNNNDLIVEVPPSYISKKQNISYTDTGQKLFEGGIIASEWPVHISWNKDDISDFESNYHTDNMRLLITTWYPPGGWFDASCCGCGPSWPNYFTLMSDSSSVEIEANDICFYDLNTLDAKSGLFYIGFEYYTSSVKLTDADITCWYNSQNENLVIQNLNQHHTISIEIFDITRAKLFNRQVNPNFNSTLNLNVSLQNGIYFVKLSDLFSHSLLSTFKIIKK